MDPYEMLDLPPSTKLLPSQQQRDLLTERYLQLLDRAGAPEERLSLQTAWQHAMHRANAVPGAIIRPMSEWVEAGAEILEEANMTPGLAADEMTSEAGPQAGSIQESTPDADVSPSSILRSTDIPVLATVNEDEEDSTSEAGAISSIFTPTETDFIKLPCPYGHQHRYDDEHGARRSLTCHSCRTIFSAVIGAECRDFRKATALSSREREWTVICLDPDAFDDFEHLHFRGPADIPLEIGHRFSLVSATGARGTAPFWIVNHSVDEMRALSGEGTGWLKRLPMKTPPPSSSDELKRIGRDWLLPIAALAVMLQFLLHPILAVVLAIALVVLVFRPYFAPWMNRRLSGKSPNRQRAGENFVREIQDIHESTNPPHP